VGIEQFSGFGALGQLSSTAAASGASTDDSGCLYDMLEAIGGVFLLSMLALGAIAWPSPPYPWLHKLHKDTFATSWVPWQHSRSDVRFSRCAPYRGLPWENISTSGISVRSTCRLCCALEEIRSGWVPGDALALSGQMYSNAAESAMMRSGGCIGCIPRVSVLGDLVWLENFTDQYNYDREVLAAQAEQEKLPVECDGSNGVVYHVGRWIRKIAAERLRLVGSALDAQSIKQEIYASLLECYASVKTSPRQ